MTGKRAGYYGVGINQGKFVANDDALEYAMQQCGITSVVVNEDAPDAEEFLSMLEDWYFSDGWIHVEEEKEKCAKRKE